MQTGSKQSSMDPHCNQPLNESRNIDKIQFSASMADSSNWQMYKMHNSSDDHKSIFCQILVYHLLSGQYLQYSKSWQEAEDRTKQDVDMSIATTTKACHNRAINFRLQLQIWTLTYVALK
jgi:hypothetical protein